MLRFQAEQATLYCIHLDGRTLTPAEIARPGDLVAVTPDSDDLDCPVEAVEPGERSRVFRLGRRGTEDVAHAIGAQTQTAVLFDVYSNLPMMGDLTWYRDEG